MWVVYMESDCAIEVDTDIDTEALSNQDVHSTSYQALLLDYFSSSLAQIPYILQMDCCKCFLPHITHCILHLDC